jgi:hypothetical protein
MYNTKKTHVLDVQYGKNTASGCTISILIVSSGSIFAAEENDDGIQSIKENQMSVGKKAVW